MARGRSWNNQDQTGKSSEICLMSMSGHIRCLKDPLEVRVKHETYSNTYSKTMCPQDGAHYDVYLLTLQI